MLLSTPTLLRPAALRCTLSLLALGFCLSGCAAFIGNDLPVYTFADLPPAPAQEKKVCLIIDYKDKRCDKDCREWSNTLIEMFEKSGYFLKAPEHCTPANNANHNTLDMISQRDFRFSNFAVAIITGFISGATFTVVPAYERTDLIFRIQFKKNDHLVKEYVYREHVNCWIHVSLLFTSYEQTSRTVTYELTNRVFMNFLHDYANDVQQGRIDWGD